MAMKWLPRVEVEPGGRPTMTINDSVSRKSCEANPKKPYHAPSFRFERVFEVSALSCGKVNPTEGSCRTNRKVS